MTITGAESSSTVSVRELSAPVEIQAAQRLRYIVWRSEGAVINHAADEMIADHHDDHAIHWGAFDGNELVGAARLCLHNDLSEAPDAEMFLTANISPPFASMNRLVVLSSHRGQGIGKLFDQVRIQKARDSGSRTVVIAPINVYSRKQSLRKQGFQVLSGIAGHAKWSPSVEICACYLMFDQLDAVNNA
jgi:GNAT superfamily N-acetyltransferase